MKSRKVVLASYPKGIPTLDNFAIVEQEIPEPGDGEIVTENLIFALEPAVRGLLDGNPDSYRPSVELGSRISAMIFGRVIKSRHPDYKEGDFARGFIGLEEHSVIRPNAAFPVIHNVRVDPGLPMSAYMSALGWSGITAYVGLKKIGAMQAGDGVLMSAAAGAVGGIGGQIAKLSGCYVVGMVGSQAKADLVTTAMGMDQAINYNTSEDLAAEIRGAFPGGVSLYFDNVGGRVLNTVMPLMKDAGHIVICGMMSNYNDWDNPYPMTNLWQMLVHRMTMRGFLASEHPETVAEAREQLERWMKAGQLVSMEDVTTGFENAPGAFIRLLSGQTTGKTLVRINDSIAVGV